MMTKKRPSWCPSGNEELLLKAALWNQEEALSAWNNWVARNDIDKIESRLYPLGAMIYQNLKDKIHEPYMEKLKGVWRSIWFKNQFLFNNVKPVLKAIEREKIPIFLLKGTVLVLNYYKNIGLRPMEDLDFLIPRQEAMRVMGILEKCGWKQYEMFKFPNGELIRRRHALGFRNINGQSIDLHWESLWCSYKSDLDGWLWQEARDFLFEGISVKILSPSDQFFHICIHGARKNLWSNSQDLKWITDAMKIIRLSPALDWERVIDLCRESSVTLQMKEAINYLYLYLRAPISAQVLEKFNGLTLTRMERVHYYSMVDPKVGSKLIFWVIFGRLRVGYIQWLRRNYGLKEVSNWSVFKLFMQFIFFFKTRLNQELYFAVSSSVLKKKDVFLPGKARQSS